jgi:hypothetical protein
MLNNQNLKLIFIIRKFKINFYNKKLYVSEGESKILFACLFTIWVR